MSQTLSLRRSILAVSFVSLLLLLSFAVRTAESATSHKSNILGAATLIEQYHGAGAAAAPAERTRSTQTGIVEDVPKRYLARYQQWKSEFLATDTGRQQWA